MRARRSWLGPLGTLTLAGLPALAGAQQVGSEFQINTYTTSNQRTRSYGGHLVAGAADGDFVVVWHGLGQGDSNDGIFGQRYDSAGGTLGSEFRVNSFTTKAQRYPSVAVAADGHFVVVWSSYAQDGSSFGIFGQRYDSGGTAQGSEFRVNSYTTRGQSNPLVASDASGNFVVVWTSDRQDGEGYGIFGQRYDSGGLALGSEFRVNSYTTNWQYMPSVARAAEGDFVVVWVSSSQDGDAAGIFGQRYDSGGEAQGSEFRVNSYTTSWQQDPSVASDASGNFVVGWSGHGRGDPFSIGIFGQRYDSEGMAQGDEFRVNSYTTGLQTYPSVASDASRNFVVVWHSNGQDGSGFGVFGQRYDKRGVPAGGEFRVNSYTTSSQQLPSVGATGVGEFVVAWESDGQDESGFGVFGQRFGFGGDPIPPGVTVTAPNGGERLFTGLSYAIQWTTTDVTALSFDVLVSADAGGSFTPIAECQNLPGSTRSCLWLAPGPPSASAVVRVTMENTSGNSASDDSDAVFTIVSGTASVTVESPNSDVKWQIGSLQSIEWTHDLGLNSTFRIELDRDDDGSYEELIAAAAPADGARSGSFAWKVTGPPSATCRVRASWTANLAATDSSDVTFQITGDPSEFQINTYTTGRQYTYLQTRAVAADASGNFVVVWWSYAQDGSGFGVFGQRYDSAGVALGTEFLVNSSTGNNQKHPSVAAAADGHFVVVWDGFGLGDSLDGIFGQRYDSAGRALGNEFHVNSFTPHPQLFPAIASDAAGNFVVAWQCQTMYDTCGIRGQRYDSAGVAQGGEFVATNDAYRGPEWGEVATDANGNFVVVWGGYSQGGGIFGQRYDSAGETLGTEFRVNSYTTGGHAAPSVASSDGSGNFIVVWKGQGQGDNLGIFGQRYDSEGVPAGSEFRVNSYTTGDQDYASVARDENGNFVVTWTSDAQDGSGAGVFAKRYDSAGVAQGAEFQVNSYTTRSQDYASVAATGVDQFVVVWTSGYGDDVFGRRFDFTGLPSLSISDVSINEGNVPGRASRNWALFVVTLSAPSAQPVSLDYATANGTAMAPSDYIAKSGTLTLSPGQTSAVVAVRVKEDDVHESDETFFVNLSNPMNATIADGQGLGKIQNDDP